MIKNSERIEVISVNAFDLEDLIKDTYNSNFEIIQDLEQNNDTYQLIEVKKKALQDYEQEELDEFIKTGEHSFITHTCLQDLVNKNTLEEGQYLINISW